MASGVFDDALIKHLWSTDELRAIFSDRNRVQKWYAFESALALEQGVLGIIPQAAANEIAAKARVENVDIEAIAAEIRKNLDLLGGFLLSERVMFVLSEKVGKQTAHDLVYEASMHGLENGMSFERSLMENKRVRDALSADELRKALDPTTYVGRAPQIVDEVLAQQKADGWLD